MRTSFMLILLAGLLVLLVLGVTESKPVVSAIGSAGALGLMIFLLVRRAA